jgi:predicted O-methyltransferase YrrM
MEIFIGVYNGKYKMDHFYQDISGFMSHKNTVMLDLVLAQFPAGGTWVELGSWTGRSAAYCAVELINRNKLGEFYCVDTWKGEAAIAYDPATVQDLKKIFRHNVKPVLKHIKMLSMISWNAARRFNNNSVDFCYVDAGHSYEAVTNDLTAWWPKLRAGSMFAGDDYTKGYPGVQQAVWDFFGPRDIRVCRSGRCWLVTKPFDDSSLI